MTGLVNDLDDIWRYDGRTAVVTGCASGIGAATAAELSRLGARVVGLDRAQPLVEVDRFIEADLSTQAAVEAAVAAIPDTVDHVFACAGVSAGAGLSPEKVFAINFLGTRALIEGLVPRLSSGASIVSVSSLAAIDYAARWDDIRGVSTQPWHQVVAWCAAHPESLTRGAGYPFSKELLATYTLERCVALGRTGIRLNCIAPGVTDTPMLEPARRRPETRAQIENMDHVLGRVSRADEQANALVFLNSRAASYITGVVLFVDGGYSVGVRTGEVQAVVGGAGQKRPS